MVRATQRPLESVKVDQHNIPIGANGSMVIKDAGLAAEVETRFGRHGELRTDVVTVPLRKPHGMMFTVPELPWKKKPDA